jgi:protein TonB
METDAPGISSKIKTMTSNEILKADVLDIIFDNRNKQYGAYALRKYYQSRLSAALAIAFSSVLLLYFLVINIHESSSPGVEAKKTAYEVTAVKLPEPEPEEKLPEPQQRKAQPQVQMAQEKLVDNIAITRFPPDVPPTQQQLATSVIGTTTFDGPPAGPGMTPPAISPVTGGGGEPKPEPKPESGFVAIERAAHFPGGMDAWMNFLRGHLVTPGDLEPGEQKTVHVRFLVSAEGEVTGFEVVRSAGALFDREVIRALKKMPKWVPAMQNGHAVAVSFTQAVTFVGLEE